MTKNVSHSDNGMLLSLILYVCIFFPLTSVFHIGSTYGVGIMLGVWLLVCCIQRAEIVVTRSRGVLLAILFAISFFLLLPNAYRVLSKVMNVINMMICTLFALSVQTDERGTKIALGVFQGAALLFSIYIIACGIFPEIYKSYILPHLRGISPSAALQLQKQGYGVMIGGSSIYGDYIINPAIMISLAQLLFSRGRKTIHTWLLILIYCAAIILEGRRGEFVNTAFAAAFLFLFAAPKGSYLFLRRLFLLILFVGVAAVMLVVLMEQGYGTRFADTISMLENNSIDNLTRSVTSGRTDLWEVAWNAFLEEPVLGIGFGKFKLYAGVSYAENVHNTYLQFLCETGIVGFCLIMIPQVYLFFRTFVLFREIRDNKSADWSLWACIFVSTGMQLFFLLEHMIDPVFFRFFFYPLFIISFILYDYASEAQRAMTGGVTGTQRRGSHRCMYIR